MAQDEYIVYHSSPKLIAFAIYIGLLTVGLPFVLIRGAYQHHTIDAGLWVFLTVFGLFSVYALVKILRLLACTSPALIINQEGIFDNVAVMGAVGKIPWDNIARFEVRGGGMMRALCISPRNQAALLKDKPLFTRIGMLTHKLEPGGVPVRIMPLMLSVTADTMCDEMRRHRPDLYI